MEDRASEERLAKRQKVDSMNDLGPSSEMDASIELPLELWLEIARHCDLLSLVRLSMTCSSIYHLVVDDEELWLLLFKARRTKPIAVVPSPSSTPEADASHSPSTSSFESALPPLTPSYWRYACHTLTEYEDIQSALDAVEGGERLFIAPGEYTVDYGFPDGLDGPIELIGEGEDVLKTDLSAEAEGESDDEEQPQQQPEQPPQQQLQHSDDNNTLNTTSEKKQKPPPTTAMFRISNSMGVVSPMSFRNLSFLAKEDSISLDIFLTKCKIEDCTFRAGVPIVATENPYLCIVNCKFLGCETAIVSYIRGVAAGWKKKLTEVGEIEKIRGTKEEPKEGRQLIIEGCTFDSGLETAIDVEDPLMELSVERAVVKGYDNNAITIACAKSVSVSHTEVSDCLRAIWFKRYSHVEKAVIDSCYFHDNEYEAILVWAPLMRVDVKRCKIDSTGALCVAGYFNTCIFSDIPGEENVIYQETGVAANCIEAIGKKLCTYTATGDKFYVQNWVNCETCKWGVSSGCCLSCAEICHKGHELSSVQKVQITTAEGQPLQANYGLFFCDCGSTHRGLCKALEKA